MIKNKEMEGNNVEEIREEKNVVLKEALKFSESGIHPDILRAVHEMGFENMTPIQEQSIPVLLEGKDIIGQAQTGTGKTAAFAIPMIQSIDPEIKKPQGIILCPTRELAMQAAEEIRRLSKYMHGVKVLPVYGGQDIGRQIRALSQGVQIIVGTPGRVMDHLRRHTIKTAEVKMIVLDEADEMLDMGFREDIETVLSDMPEEHQMALFSATMPQEILDIAGAYQNSAVYIRVTPKELTVSAIKQAYYRVAKKDKMKALCRLLDYYQPARSLIFCNTKRMVDEIAGQLKDKGYEAEGLHGDLSQNQRDTVGRKGRSFTLISGREIFKIRSIEKVCHTTIRERKLPSPDDIVRVKSEKIFVSAMEVMDHKDLSEVKASIEKAAEEKGFTVLDLAAAFMQMNMGEVPEEIEEEKPYPERSRRESGGERRRRSSRDFGRRDLERRDFGRRDSGKNREERWGGKREERYSDRGRSGRKGKEGYTDSERFGRRDAKYTDSDRGKKRSRQSGKKILDDKPLGRLLSKRK